MKHSDTCSDCGLELKKTDPKYDVGNKYKSMVICKFCLRDRAEKKIAHMSDNDIAEFLDYKKI